MELQLKYHKHVWKDFFFSDLHIFKVTSWLPFQLTLLKPICLNQDNHVTWRQEFIFHKDMENLDGTCSYIRGTANSLISRSRSGNMFKGCSMSSANPLWTTVENTPWQQDTAQGMQGKVQINWICLLNLLIPCAREELSLTCPAYLTND